MKWTSIYHHLPAILGFTARCQGFDYNSHIPQYRNIPDSDHRCCPAAMLPRGRTVPRCSMLPRGRIDCSTGPLFLERAMPCHIPVKLSTNPEVQMSQCMSFGRVSCTLSVIPTYSKCSSLRDDPINWELASKTILQNPTSLSMQSHAVPYVSDFGALVDPWHWALSYACFVSPSHPHPWCPKGTSFPSNWRLCLALWVMFNLDRGTDCRMTTNSIIYYRYAMLRALLLQHWPNLRFGGEGPHLDLTVVAMQSAGTTRPKTSPSICAPPDPRHFSGISDVVNDAKRQLKTDPTWVCLKMLCTPKPNGFADHYPYYMAISLGIYPIFRQTHFRTTVKNSSQA